MIFPKSWVGCVKVKVIEAGATSDTGKVNSQIAVGSFGDALGQSSIPLCYRM